MQLKLEFNYYSGWVGGWVVEQNKSNTKLNSVEVNVEIRAELGNGDIGNKVCLRK